MKYYGNKVLIKYNIIVINLLIVIFNNGVLIKYML